MTPPAGIEAAESPVAVVDKNAAKHDLGGWAAVQKKHFADGGVFDQFF